MDEERIVEGIVLAINSGFESKSTPGVYLGGLRIRSEKSFLNSRGKEVRDGWLNTKIFGATDKPEIEKVLGLPNLHKGDKVKVTVGTDGLIAKTEVTNPSGSYKEYIGELRGIKKALLIIAKLKIYPDDPNARKLLKSEFQAAFENGK